MIAAFVVENLTFGLISKGIKLTVAKTARTATRVVAKLAQASKAEELATTAEGIKIPARVADDAMVLEMEAEKAASTSMMENQAQKAGAKVEQAAAKNIIAVNNMKEFFTQTKFGQTLKENCLPTKYIEQGQKIFKVTEKIVGILDKNDYFYLDNAHKNHLEVFSGTGVFKKVLNLDGTINEAKTANAIGRRITLS